MFQENYAIELQDKLGVCYTRISLFTYERYASDHFLPPATGWPTWKHRRTIVRVISKYPCYTETAVCKIDPNILSLSFVKV